MSGGVDSSVAALLLKDQGYDVVGLSMSLYRCPREGTSGCCTAADRNDARAVCEVLGIPHVTLDAAPAFNRRVIDPFVGDYLSARTPTPCIWCNQFLKFPLLVERMEALGGEAVATGHYARLERDDTGGVSLLRGVDHAKDQSYFLFSVRRRDLVRTLFPVGGLDKPEVRDIAARHGLPVSDKPESQEICFVPDGDYVDFLEDRAGDRLGGAGRFVDTDGSELGRHRGIHAYTIGQRKGLKLGGGPKRYVVRIDPRANEVVLGDRADLMRGECTIRDLNWLDPAVELSAGHGEALSVSVKIRSRHEPAGAVVTILAAGRFKVTFDEPVSAVAPGQAAVLYDGERVLGGGWIES